MTRNEAINDNLQIPFIDLSVIEREVLWFNFQHCLEARISYLGPYACKLGEGYFARFHPDEPELHDAIPF